jgi:hypothetical protein
MGNIQFTNNELDYINKNVFDSTNDIYAYSKYPNIPKSLPNTYTIVCTNLPIGSYSLNGKNIDLHFNTKYMLAYGGQNFMDTRYTESDVFNFIVKNPCDRILLQVKNCKHNDIDSIVKELRRQAFLNQNKLEQQDILSL